MYKNRTIAFLGCQQDASHRVVPPFSPGTGIYNDHIGTKENASCILQTYSDAAPVTALGHERLAPIERT
jgi:hypothetical protein